jgi:hypothetical protein
LECSDQQVGLEIVHPPKAVDGVLRDARFGADIPEDLPLRLNVYSSMFNINIMPGPFLPTYGGTSQYIV